jgi:hypothetical protein
MRTLLQMIRPRSGTLPPRRMTRQSAAAPPRYYRVRDAGQPAPRAQIRTGPIKAYGSRLGW